MSIKDWNIEGIAEGVIREMKEDGADIGNIEDYIREVFWTVYSRDVDNADLVAEMVKKLFVKNTKRRTLKMKFDLKKLEILEANSEETLCFSARLYIDGAFAATVHNDGQ